MNAVQVQQEFYTVICYIADGKLFHSIENLRAFSVAKEQKTQAVVLAFVRTSHGVPYRKLRMVKSGETDIGIVNTGFTEFLHSAFLKLSGDIALIDRRAFQFFCLQQI